MKGITALLGSCVLFAGSAWASQPGQPLDCSDWVFTHPGLRCTAVIPFPCGDPGNPDPNCYYGLPRQIDNDGGVLRVRSRWLSGGAACARNQSLNRLEIVQFRGGQTEVLAYVDDRCGPNPMYGSIDALEYVVAANAGSGVEPAGAIVFDDKTGRLYVPLVSVCRYGNQANDCPNYTSGHWLVAIDGFTTAFDIVQTYTPTANNLGFRVPAIPEGLHSADHFDTYWGHVSDLPDFTHAQPMVCHYPPTPPAVGDYLTVADTSPTPAPGRSNYIVTAVRNGTQRRYGRKRINGVMSGRDPALLPACPVASVSP